MAKAFTLRQRWLRVNGAERGLGGDGCVVVGPGLGATGDDEREPLVGDTRLERPAGRLLRVGTRSGTDLSGRVRRTGRWVGMDAVSGRAWRLAAMIAAGSLVMAACAGDDTSVATDDVAATSGSEDGSAGQDSGEVDDGSVSEDAADVAEGDAGADREAGVAPARGSLTVGDDAYELETAYHCPPRDAFEGAEESVRVTAEWDLPPDQIPEGLC